MKKRLIILIVVMVLGGLAYPLLKGGDGYVLIAYNHTTVEMSIWTGLLLVVLSFVMWSFLWRILRGGKRVATIFSDSNAKPIGRSQEQTMAALVEFMAGSWSNAKKTLIKNVKKSSNPSLNLLAAARCSHELHQTDEALALLKEAEETSGSREMIAIIRAQILFDEGQYNNCLTELSSIKTNMPEHPGMLNLLADVYWILGEYNELQALLPTLKRYKIIDAAAIEKLEANIVRMALIIKNDDLKNISIEENRSSLNEAWRKLSATAQKTPSLMADYAAQLNLLGSFSEAEEWLLKSIKKEWSIDAVSLYGKLESENPAAQLQHATKWLSEHENDAVLQCTLGRICMRNELWGKARDNFQKSIAINPTPEVHIELAVLLEQLGEFEAANLLYKEGLQSVLITSEDD